MVSFDSLLVQRAAVMRRSAGSGEDEHGGDTDVFASIATDVPCRLSTTRGTEVTDASGARRLVTTVIGFLLDTDVTAADRVVIDGQTWELLSVDTVQMHHLRAGAERR
jgi:hypothetical protein